GPPEVRELAFNPQCVFPAQFAQSRQRFLTASPRWERQVQGIGQGGPGLGSSRGGGVAWEIAVESASPSPNNNKEFTRQVHRRVHGNQSGQIFMHQRCRDGNVFIRSSLTWI